MVAEPDPLDRGGPEAELAPGWVDLSSTLYEHALAVAEPELEVVEPAAGHGRPQGRADQRIPEREEHERPRVVTVQLGYLSLDPQGGDLAEVETDPLVEGGDAEDLAVAVERRLDLHPSSVDVGRPCQRDGPAPVSTAGSRRR